MPKYIERESAIKSLLNDCLGQVSYSREDAADCIRYMDNADVATVRHGRWIGHEETPEDAYWHHKCSECNVNAPFDYKMREDWDEGMDGEWYSLGLVDDGINEHLTKFCPNCGAKMDGKSNVPRTEGE